MPRAELTQRLKGGVTPAMATPLAADGYTVAGDVAPALVDFLISAGVSGLFVGGTTGEGILLPAGERLFLHETVVMAVAGRAPTLIHVGANDTATACTLAEHAARIGADAIVAVTPYFYGVSQEALEAHFIEVAAAAPDTPFFVYDIPQMATNGISPALLARLGERIPAFAGVKTSHPDAQHVRSLIDAAPAEAIVLAGNERIALGLLALGADGLISGLSTAIPEPFVALTRAFKSGDLAEARRQQRIINALLDHLPAGARIGAIKQILVDRGIAVGRPMPPRSADTQSRWPEMKALLG